MRLWLLFVLVGFACGSSCDCACDYRELGRGTWMLLHEMVDREPSERLEASFISLMWSLSDLYPCEECREHLVEYLYNHPPEMSKEWMCRLHNDVNRRLGKEEQPCWDI